VEERPPLTLRNALLHRWLLVLAIVGAFLLAAGLLSLRKPVYAASAAIYLDVSRTAPGFDEGVAAGELLQHDFIVASQSRPVLEAACASAGVACTPQELAAPESTLAKRISASSYRGTSTLLVMARAPTPDQAAALANAVAQAIIDQDKAEVVRLFKQPRDNLQKQLTDLQAAMAEEQQQLQHSPAGSPAAAAHQAQLTRLQGQHSVVFGRWQDLAEQQDRLTSVATVGQPAVPPARPEGPGRLRYLAAGLLAGVCLGVLAALLVERFNDRIFNVETLARATQSPVALLDSGAGRRGRTVHHGPYSLALASVLARAPETRTVLVTAASHLDHTDAVAAGLGAVAAEAGQRVVVVQTDGRSPERPSLATSAAGGVTTVTAPAQNGGSLAATVTEVRREVASPDTFVVVAVPSPDSSPSAFLLGRTAKRAVLVATAGITRVQDARRSAELLRYSGVEVAAAILQTRRASKGSR